MALPNTDSLLPIQSLDCWKTFTNALSSEVEDGHWPEAEWSQLSELGLTVFGWRSHLVVQVLLFQRGLLLRD